LPISCKKSKYMKNLIFAGTFVYLTAGVLAADTNGVMSIRLGSGETSLEQYKEYGYNAIMMGDLTQLASYDELAPGAIADNSQLRRNIDKYRRDFVKKVAQAQKMGLDACVVTDEIQFPIPVYDRFKYQILKSNNPKKMDINFDSQEFWDLYLAKYREVLKAYPQIKYVMVRTGENYSHPEKGYVGRTVIDHRIDDAYYRNMQRLIEETRKVVVDEFGRTLIWRTWDLGDNGFHASPAVYDRVLAGVPDRRGLIMAVKITKTDFWHYNYFNPNIGRGDVDQIIEFECDREYEGKGAFPDYVGVAYAEGMKLVRDRGVKGVWIWDFGGGWGGPFLKDDMWVRLNIYATTRLAQNPELSPRNLAGQWAAQEFGTNAAPKVTDMLMLSDDCITKLFYIAPYSREHPWSPSRNLLRDDIIHGEASIGSNGGLKDVLYEGSKSSLQEALDEKTQAVALAQQMRSIFESQKDDIVAERGEKVYDDGLSSLIYLEDLAEVVSHYVRGMFLFYHWQDTGDTTAANQANQELLAWRDAWKTYQTEVPKLPGAASIYRSLNTQEPDSTQGAMTDTCEKALQALAARPQPAQTAK